MIFPRNLRDEVVMASPKYSYPRGLLAGVALDVVLLRCRDFRRDAKACLGNLQPPLRVLGREDVPTQGPCVITVNHYHRTGFGAQWIALAVAATISADMHWVMTGEFTYPGKWYEKIGAYGSRLLLGRLARIYGFSSMPPMPPRQKDVEARAASVRKVLHFVRHAHNPILGLAPEGHDPLSGVLTRPASGVGRFGLLLSRAGLSFVPVGAYEADGVFTLRFGEAYELGVAAHLSTDEKDTRAARAIMTNIAKLLPMSLRGEFA